MSEIRDQIQQKYKKVFADSEPVLISRTSGRAELIGGHTDYNAGYVLAGTIDSSYYVAAAPSGDNNVTIHSAWAQQSDTFELGENIERSEEKKWANYARGVAACLIEKGVQLKGANLFIFGDVPIGAGLSSSAAMEVSIARALLAISGQAEQIDEITLARVCQKAENVFAKSPCGIMDQLVCITGRDEHAVFLDCRDLSTQAVPFDSGRAVIMIFNSMVKHEIASGEYGSRRSACEQACALIGADIPQVRALRDVDERTLETVSDRLDELLIKRARHVVTENQRVLEASDALGRGDFGTFGKLMYQSHCSARDNYEISCDEIDFLVDTFCDCPGGYGARLSGGGFGGAAVGIAHPEYVQSIMETVREAYRTRFDIEAEVYCAKPSQGTEIITL